MGSGRGRGSPEAGHGTQHLPLVFLNGLVEREQSQKSDNVSSNNRSKAYDKLPGLSVSEKRTREQ